jgi:DNA-nicking Smr family endonuclease
MRRRPVSDEERALWSRATKDVSPLAGTRGAAPRTPGGLDPKPPAGAARSRSPGAAKAQPPGPRPSVFAAGDPKVEAKARRGRRAIDRTLDLHGLGQDAARRRLERFLAAAAADGLSCVLVITGRGAPDDPARRDPDRPPRGVLRARFLEWIEAPPLRALIARAAGAAPRHGGPGAFYLFLKSRR